MMTTVSAPAIALSAVRKTYDGVTAVDEVSLSAEPGSLLVLLGPSGCGKTTTLRLIAGLETPDDGTIALGGVTVSAKGTFVPPEHRRVGMVFQDYALFPHLSAGGNIEFAIPHLPVKARRARAADLLALVGLAGRDGRYPHQLSGGEQQRVALARALAAQPEVVLLDEPFSNLDAALRKDMREEVRRILREARATAVFVTHDQEEALSLGDQVAIMRGGRLEQIGRPQDVYLRPATRDVATFLGEANFVRGEASGGAVETALGRLPLLVPRQGAVDVLIRPEAIKLEPDPQGAVRIRDLRYFGHDQLVEITLPTGEHLRCRTWARLDLRPGEPVRAFVHGPVLAYARQP